MLSYIWVSVRGALSRAVPFWISWLAVLGGGQPFLGDTLAFNLTGSFKGPARGAGRFRRATRQCRRKRLRTIGFHHV